jgi:DNA-binding beta-propeller fold protein YncE
MMYDFASQKVTATIPVGNDPRKFAVQPGSTTTATAFAPAVVASAEQPRESSGD